MKDLKSMVEEELETLNQLWNALEDAIGMELDDETKRLCKQWFVFGQGFIKVALRFKDITEKQEVELLKTLCIIIEQLAKDRMETKNAVHH